MDLSVPLRDDPGANPSCGVSKAINQPPTNEVLDRTRPAQRSHAVLTHGCAKALNLIHVPFVGMDVELSNVKEVFVLSFELIKHDLVLDQSTNVLSHIGIGDLVCLAAAKNIQDSLGCDQCKNGRVAILYIDSSFSLVTWQSLTNPM